MCLIKNKYIKLEILFSFIYLKKFKSVTVNTASHTTAEMGGFFWCSGEASSVWSVGRISFMHHLVM